MNAYELADRVVELEANLKAQVDLAYRQADKLNKYELRNQEQIKRIAELEKLNAELKEYNTELNEKEHDFEMKLYLLEKDNKELHAIAQRMAMAESDARKSLQSYKDAEVSEPVAWMSPDGKVSTTEGMLFHIPLYKHQPQTKPLSEEYGINNALGFRAIKCIVKDCENHRGEGGFTGDLCNPCYEFITNGEGVYSQAYRNTQTKPLSDEEIEQCYWGDGYPDNPRCPKDFARAIEAKVRGQ